jgi:hypothetical protein
MKIAEVTEGVAMGQRFRIKRGRDVVTVERYKGQKGPPEWIKIRGPFWPDVDDTFDAVYEISFRRFTDTYTVDATASLVKRFINKSANKSRSQ